MTTPTTGVKAQEVMYLNYLQCQGKIWQVNDIFGASGLITVLPRNDGETMGRRSVNDYQPIPLTEQWLKEFGFTQNPSYKNLYFKDQFRYQLSNRYITLLRPCDKSGESQQNECGYPFLTDRIKCEYVHQLQNLYFALTATHLNRMEDERNNDLPISTGSNH